jgi:hypothetical protein
MKNKKIILFLLLSCLLMQAIKATELNTYKYHYIPLGEGFYPVGIDEKQNIYGNKYNAVSKDYDIYVYANGILKFYKHGYINQVNKHGVGAGYITTATFENGVKNSQAAVFDKGKIKLIPYLKHDFNTRAFSINDNGLVLVWSLAKNMKNFYYVYKNNKKIFHYRLPNDGGGIFWDWEINNKGIIVGGFFDNYLKIIRFDPPYKSHKILAVGDGSSVYDINNNGVLGISSKFSGAGIEAKVNHSYGIWDNKGVFKSYHNSSSSMENSYSYVPKFNDKNIFVLSDNNNDIAPYIMTQPNKRINLIKLLDNANNLNKNAVIKIHDISNSDDIIGRSCIKTATEGEKCTGFLMKKI